MLNIDFYNLFINIDFDAMLSNENNPLINSKEFYLNYKNEYFDQTHKNYSQYLRYNAELQKLKDLQYTVKPTKYHFVYLDQNRLDSLKNDLKKIILCQNTLFENFKHHITKLNTDKELFLLQNQKESTSNQRGLLSLFNRSKKSTAQVVTLPPGTLKRSKSNASTKSNRSIKSIQSFKSFRE